MLPLLSVISGAVSRTDFLKRPYKFVALQNSKQAYSGVVDAMCSPVVIRAPREMQTSSIHELSVGKLTKSHFSESADHEFRTTAIVNM